MTAPRRWCLAGLIALGGLLASGCDIVWPPQPAAAAEPPALPSASPSLAASPTAQPTAGAPVTVVPPTAIPPSPSGDDAGLRAQPAEATPPALVLTCTWATTLQPPEAGNWFLTSFASGDRLGGTESLAEHPGTMTHSDIPPDEQAELGTGDDPPLVGVEHPEDLIADLTQALEAV